jgi:hypothetical protein
MAGRDAMKVLAPEADGGIQRADNPAIARRKVTA